METYSKLIPVIEGLIRAVNCLDKIPTLTYTDYYFNRMKLIKRIDFIDDELWSIGIDYRVYTKLRVGTQNKSVKYIANDC